MPAKQTPLSTKFPFKQTDLDCYIVGGYVRDYLLGIKSSDKDWVVVGTKSQDMINRGFNQVGKDFPVFIHPQTNEQYALARSEKKIAQGYHGFAVKTDNISLEEDLYRRDITINAMAFCLKKNGDYQLIDPLNGKKDLDNKIIRHCSNHFIEDPLRVIRVARFYAKLYHLGFKVDPKTIELLKQLVQSGELETIAGERVWLEIKKVINCQNPQIFFLFLNQIGALDLLFKDYSLNIKQKWFKNLATCFQAVPNDEMIKLSICFYAYTQPKLLCKKYVLSKKTTQLFNLVHQYRHLIQQLSIAKLSLNELKTASTNLLELCKKAQVKTNNQLIYQFISVCMLSENLSLQDRAIQRLLMVYHSFLTIDIESYLKKNKFKNNNLAKIVDNYLKEKILSTLQKYH